MQFKRLRAGLVLAVITAVGLGQARAQDGLIGKIDLGKTTGAQAVNGEWRHATVMTNGGEKKNEIEPKAHGTFDDSKWTVIPPEKLGGAKGSGYAWGWYRIKVTIPDTVDGKKFEGGPVWFQITVDDYGEIWVDGKIDLSAGRGAVQGWNVKNRVRLQKEETVDKDGKKQTVLRDAKPGDVFQIAVLGINGPIAQPVGILFIRYPILLEFFSKDANNGGADLPKVGKGPSGKAIAEIDLLSKEGVEAAKAEWRRQLLELHTGGQKNGTEPRVGKFDDNKFEMVADPLSIKKGFGPGKFSMAWYRVKFTIPDKVMTRVDGKLTEVDVSGSDVWFEILVDGYAEIWPGGGGQRNINGFKTVQPYGVGRGKAGKTVQLSLLVMNGPFGNPPDTPIIISSAVLRFYGAGQ